MKNEDLIGIVDGNHGKEFDIPTQKLRAYIPTVQAHGCCKKWTVGNVQAYLESCLNRE